MDDTQLDFGDDQERLNGPAAADYDDDGDVETVAEELAGLVGQKVEFSVVLEGDVATVYTIGGLDYRDGNRSWTVAE